MDERGDVASSLPIHWCKEENLAKQGEGRYSVRWVVLGQDDVSETKQTGHDGLDVCGRQPEIVGDKTWHLTRIMRRGQPAAVWGSPTGERDSGANTVPCRGQGVHGGMVGQMVQMSSG